jgi:hypothetical protein
VRTPKAIDDFIQAPKFAVGTASWQEGNRPSGLTIGWPLHIGGVSSGGRLTIEAVTTTPSPTYSVVLIFAERPVARLDFDPDDEHLNPLTPPEGVPAGKVTGVHAHLWDDNRPWAPSYGFLKKHPVARPVPEEHAKTFYNALAWFLEACNIQLDSETIPTLPLQGRLW